MAKDIEHFFIYLFSIFFVSTPNAFPFPGSPLSISPISPLPSAHSPINHLPLLCPGIPLQCCIKPFQDQGPLFSSFLGIIWYVNCVLSIHSFWANNHLSVTAFHVYSFVIGLPHLGWCSPAISICVRISWLHCFYCWVVFQCVNIPYFLYLFLCWGTSQFVPASGYNK